MVDALYRGNIEELLSVISHLKKYIIVFVIILLVLLSIFHFSKYSVHVVPLVTVTLVLLPAVYYTTVLVLKFGTGVIASDQTAEVGTMNAEDNRQGLKTPDIPYPKSPTPPPSYEEATRNDHCYRPQPQPRPWLPSTSGGYTTGGGVFDVEYQYDIAVSSSDVCNGGRSVMTTTAQNRTVAPKDVKTCTTTTTTLTALTTSTTIQNIPSVTITLDNDLSEI